MKVNAPFYRLNLVEEYNLGIVNCGFNIVSIIGYVIKNGGGQSSSGAMN